MARVPSVTRTIVTTKVNALCLNLTDTTPFNMEVVLSGTYKDSKKLDKALANYINNDERKYVHTVSAEEVETLYGMTEQEFIGAAKVYDKETRKPLEQ